jgi:hypothetical protein
MGRLVSIWRLWLAAAALTCGAAAPAQETPPAAPSPAPPPAPSPAPAQPEAVAPEATPAPAAAAPAETQPVTTTRSEQQEPPPLALPAIPPAPSSALPDYPGCRDEYLALHGRIPQAGLVLSCITRLDQYYENILRVYFARIERYRTSLSEVWDQVNASDDYTREQKREFYDRVRPEFEKSGEDGAYLDNYRLLYGRYRADRDFLRTLYCNLVSCR